MTYFKILTMAVASVSALGLFADGNKQDRAKFAWVFSGASCLFLLAVVLQAKLAIY